jgi:hypothetical protein
VGSYRRRSERSPASTRSFISRSGEQDHLIGMDWTRLNVYASGHSGDQLCVRLTKNVFRKGRVLKLGTEVESLSFLPQFWYWLHIAETTFDHPAASAEGCS